MKMVTESLQTTMLSLLYTTQLLRRINHTPVDYTEETKFLGKVYFEEDGHDYAVASLLASLDDALFFGDSSICPASFDGLFPRALKSANRELFYEIVANNPQMQLFTRTPAGFVGEGELPPSTSVTFAVDPAGLVWRQLLPCVSIGLVPEREGKYIYSIAGNTVTFEHEGSVTRKRRAALIYGHLVVNTPVLALVEE